ncbi:MAG: nucleotidyltransferase domain-containing protein, partial [Thermodesulfobacteriota bacterium]
MKTEHLIDAELSSILLLLKEKDLLSTVKEYVRDHENILRKRHLQGASGKDIVIGYTLLMDELIKALYKKFEQKYHPSKDCALVAMGGYGRGELNPRSDIDLMFLYRSRVTPFVKRISEKILYILWDTGLDVGSGVRSCKECMGLAADDLKTRTSLLDSRFLVGNRNIDDDFSNDVNKKYTDRNK